MSADPFPTASSTHARPFDTLGRLRRRLVASIAGIVAWISFTLLYVAFWAPQFTLFQNIVVVIVSLVVLIGGLAVAWITFGLGFAHRWSDWSD
jgi:hypothetical protein